MNLKQPRVFLLIGILYSIAAIIFLLNYFVFEQRVMWIVLGVVFLFSSVSNFIIYNKRKNQ